MPDALRVRAEPRRLYFQCALCSQETWQPAWRMLNPWHDYVIAGRFRCEHCRQWIDFDEEEIWKLAAEAVRLEDERRNNPKPTPGPT